MRLFVPRVGDKIKLIENWTCSIYSEYRNKSVFSALGIEEGRDTQQNVISVTIPKGTVLNFARVYIRAPASDYDSVTFSVEDSPLKSLKKARFWVKATEASKIEYEHYSPDLNEIKKFKELFRVVARNIGLEDLQQLTQEENEQVLYEIVKEKAQLLINTQVTKQELTNLMLSKIKYCSHAFHEATIRSEIEQYLLEDKYEVNLKMYSVLDHLIIKNDNTDLYKKLNKLFDKYCRGWRKPYLKLADNDIIVNLKEQLLSDILNTKKGTLYYLDRQIEMENVYDINKYIKKILKEPNVKIKTTKNKM